MEDVEVMPISEARPPVRDLLSLEPDSSEEYVDEVVMDSEPTPDYEQLQRSVAVTVSHSFAIREWFAFTFYQHQDWGQSFQKPMRY